MTDGASNDATWESGYGFRTPVREPSVTQTTNKSNKAEKKRKSALIEDQRLGLRSVLAAIAPWLVIFGLLYIAFFTHPGSLGRTVQPLPIVSIDRFYGAATAADGSFWLAGSFGKIVNSTDNGDSWAIQPTPTSATLQSVAAWGSQNAVAVGDHATVLYTNDGGDQWTQSSSVPLSGTFNKLIRVEVFPNGTAWAVGVNGAILESTDRGVSWQRRRPAERIIFHDIADSGSRVWVIGEFGTVLSSKDGGTNWVKQKTNVDATLNAIAFRDARHGVIAGLGGVLLTTSNGGKTWKKVELGAGKHFYAVAWNGTGWLATGADGLVASAGPAATEWVTHRLAAQDFSWHTAIVPHKSGWLLAGSSVGFYEGGVWNRIVSDRKRGAK